MGGCPSGANASFVRLLSDLSISTLRSDSQPDSQPRNASICLIPSSGIYGGSAKIHGSVLLMNTEPCLLKGPMVVVVET